MRKSTGVTDHIIKWLHLISLRCFQGPGIVHAGLLTWTLDGIEPLSTKFVSPIRSLLWQVKISVMKRSFVPIDGYFSLVEKTVDQSQRFFFLVALDEGRHLLPMPASFSVSQRADCLCQQSRPKNTTRVLDYFAPDFVFTTAGGNYQMPWFTGEMKYQTVSLPLSLSLSVYRRSKARADCLLAYYSLRGTKKMNKNWNTCEWATCPSNVNVWETQSFQPFIQAESIHKWTYIFAEYENFLSDHTLSDDGQTWWDEHDTRYWLVRAKLIQQTPPNKKELTWTH